MARSLLLQAREHINIPGPCSLRIHSQTMYTTCLLWFLNVDSFFYFILVFFFLRKEGEESHARMSGRKSPTCLFNFSYEFHLNRWTAGNVGSNPRNM
jgi:hypothetical protein